MTDTTRTLLAPITISREGLKRLRDDLTCLACGHVMKEPIRTSCNHYFCESCFHPFTACPVCRMYQIPNSIRPQITLKRIIFQYHVLAKAVERGGEEHASAEPTPSTSNTKQQARALAPVRNVTTSAENVGTPCSNLSGTTTMNEGAGGGVPTTQQLNEWMGEEAKAALKLQENAKKLEMLKTKKKDTRVRAERKSRKEVVVEEEEEMVVTTTPSDARTGPAAPTQTPQKDDEEGNGGRTNRDDDDEDDDDKPSSNAKETPAPKRSRRDAPNNKKQPSLEETEEEERIITTTDIIPSLIPVRSLQVPTSSSSSNAKQTNVGGGPGERVIITSCVSKEWAERLVNLIKKRNAKAGSNVIHGARFVRELSGKERITHVVVATEPVPPQSSTSYLPSSSSSHANYYPEMRRCKPTFKYFLGLSCGAWIVSESWIEACEKANAWVDESRFEVDTFGTSMSNRYALASKPPHPSKPVMQKISTIARLRRLEPTPQLLFQNVDVLLGPFPEDPQMVTCFTKKQAKQLLELNGANVIDILGDAQGNGIADGMNYDHVPGFVMVGHPSGLFHENNECSFCENVRRGVGSEKRIVDAAYIMRCLSEQRRLGLEESEFKFL